MQRDDPSSRQQHEDRWWGKDLLYRMCTSTISLYSSIEGRGYVRTYVLARVYVQSIYLVGGGLIIEANIPVQELEGQRGEGAYFREDTKNGLQETSTYDLLIIQK